MNRRSMTAALVTGSMLTLAACTAMRSRGNSEEAAARRLVGVWDGTFTLQRSDGSAPDTVRGTLALVRDHSGRVWSAQLNTADDYGVYDIDFRTFGFDPRDGQSIPTAIAAVATDSSGNALIDRVRIVLHPGEARVAVILDGVLAHDAVSGDWRTDSRSASGMGHFTLTRHAR